MRTLWLFKLIQRYYIFKKYLKKYEANCQDIKRIINWTLSLTKQYSNVSS